MTVDDVSKRDAKLRKCVKERMTAGQIHRVSQGWEFPYPHVNHVWRRAEKLKLKLTEEREQLPHKKAIVETLIRVSDCCVMNGYRVTQWRIEATLGEGSGVRSDLWLVIEGHGVRRVRTFEVQRTSMPPWKYRVKMERIKRWRKRKGVEPFLSVWLVEDWYCTETSKYYEVNKAYKIACEVMEDSAMLLFLMDFLPDFRAQFDVLTEDIYMSNKQRRESLIF